MSRPTATQPHNQLLHKSLPVACVKALDDATGTAEMIVSVFNNIDFAGDRILPGFFEKSLKRKLPKGVWMHKWDTPVAKTLEAVELHPGDKRLPAELMSLGGLYIKSQFNLETQRGKEAYSDLKFGTVDEFSIGFLTVEEKRNDADNCLDLIEGELYEWSPVLVGCNPMTTPISVKSKFLGEDIETTITMAAISRLNDRLMYWAVYDALYDEETKVDEKIQYLTGAFDEFRDIALSTIKAIMSGVDGAQNNEVAAKSIRELWAEPQDDNKSVGPRAGLTLTKNYEMALAAVEEYSARAKSLCEMRAKDNRVLSDTHRDRLKTLNQRLNAVSGEMDGLLDATVAKATPAESSAARARIARRRAKLRDMGVSLTQK